MTIKTAIKQEHKKTFLKRNYNFITTLFSMKQQNRLNSHDSFEIQLPHQNRNHSTYSTFYQKLINETINNKKKCNAILDIKTDHKCAFPAYLIYLDILKSISQISF